MNGAASTPQVLILILLIILFILLILLVIFLFCLLTSQSQINETPSKSGRLAFE